MLADDFSLYEEGRIGEHGLRGCLIVIHLPDAARLGKETRFHASFFDEFFIEILRLVQACIAARFLHVNIEKNRIINGHNIPSFPLERCFT